ncbi:restriction endonuclease subunit S [Limosilactobacillus mucosae]|uniref:restriction endonuclease subunit S n=1 Tax=Limosilactobacillus mucosae TaxID=97478 RepID=UPI0006527AEA|nr:restriction endonuclease subunit S [Limosilactobacillus mucosae]
MANVEITKKQLREMGFVPKDGVTNKYEYQLYYKEQYVDTITVDFNEKKSGLVDWGHIKSLDRKTSSVLNKPEFIIQLFWYIRLVESGYKPENIAIEKAIQLGRKPAYIDLVIFSPNDVPFMVLDVKTPGKEFSQNSKELSRSEGQIASYYALSSNLQYVGVVSADFKDTYISPEQFIVSTSEWEKAGSLEEYTHNGNVTTLDEAFEISPSILPYSLEGIQRTPKDLIDLDESTSSLMFHTFLKILRKHGISDKTNAFNKVLNLFVAKIVDEFNTPESENLSFQKRNNESLEDLYTRIESLYSQGLRDFIQIYIDTDKDMNEIKQIISTISGTETDDLIKKIEHLQSKTSSDFQFKDVYDEKTYHDNLVILKELVDLIAPYKLKYAKKQQFLGDFFENILSNGFKQESGQFFTPVPLARFMVESLPLEEKTNRIMSDPTTRVLLPKMIDFASGSGHFLTEYMDRMQHIISDMDISNLSRSNKNTFQQFKSNPFEWSKNYVYGLDIDYRLVKTSKVSTFLNGDGDAVIRRGNGLDSFSSPDYVGDLHLDRNAYANPVFDVLIANPPYHVDEFKSELPNLEEDFKLGSLITENSSEIEALFVERASQLLKENGLMAIVLPSAILNTENRVYVQARKILLQRFKIVAVMKNPSRSTFAATKVETVTIFAIRRKDTDINRIKESIEYLLNGNSIQDITLNGIENCISSYLKEIFGTEFNTSDYEKLLSDTYNGKNQAAQDYTKKYKKLKKPSITRAEYIRNEEVTRLLNYVLSTHECVVIQTPDSKSKDEEELLLGYKFNNRRGYEGIHPRIKNYSIEDLTLLYGNKGKFLNKVVHDAFLGRAKDTVIDDAAKPYYRIAKLKELLDFSVKDDTFKISLNKALKETVSDYGDKETIYLEDVADFSNGEAITSADIYPGEIPVIAGGREPAYYTAEPNRETPTITVSKSGEYAGYIAYHDDPIFASDCFTITAKQNSGYSTLDLYYLLKNKQDDVYSFATGSIQKHVYVKNMERFKIPDVSSEKDKVLGLISDLKSKADEQNKRAVELQKLQKELLNSIDTFYADNTDKLITLGELESRGIIKVKGGKRIPKEYDYAPFKTKHFYPGIGDFENNSINLENAKYIDDKTFEHIKNYVLSNSDVFISAAGTIGKVGMIPQLQDKAITISLTENAHKIATVDPNMVNSRYLMFILNATQVQKSILDSVTKTGTPKLSIDSLRNIKIPFVSKEEQTKLTNTLNRFDKQITEDLVLLK